MSISHSPDSAPAPRPAASVMLLRDAASGPEVLLVKRAAKGPFPSLYVFPGGTLNEDEKALPLAMAGRCKGLDDNAASRRLGLTQGGLGYWLACIRECFEETGVLLATEEDGTTVGADSEQRERLKEYRQQLNSGDGGVMVRMCRDESLFLQMAQIGYSSHWITPKIERKRFNTRFFVATMPADQTPVHDGRELVDSIWMRPEAALKASEAGEINMILPTISNLKSLIGFDGAQKAVASRSAQEIPTIMPKFVKIDQQWVGLMPDDPRYGDYPD